MDGWMEVFAERVLFFVWKKDIFHFLHSRKLSKWPWNEMLEMLRCILSVCCWGKSDPLSCTSGLCWSCPVSQFTLDSARTRYWRVPLIPVWLYAPNLRQIFPVFLEKDRCITECSVLLWVRWYSAGKSGLFNCAAVIGLFLTTHLDASQVCFHYLNE